MSKSSKIKFPLDAFIQRLEIEGIKTTLPQRLQLLEILKYYGQREFKTPLNLKYRIAPIIAKNEFHQKRVYALFEEFIEETTDYYPPLVPENKPRIWEGNPWFIWLLLSGAFLMVFFALLRLFLPIAEDLEMRANFDAPTAVQIGERIEVHNKTLHFDPENTTFHWYLIDEKSKEVEWDSVINAPTWEMLISDLGESEKKIIRLVANNFFLTEESSDSSSLLITCKELPSEVEIIGPTKALVNEEITLDFIEKQDSGLVYTWEFGDGKDTMANSVTHRYEKPGIYRIKLIIDRPNAVGSCKVTVIHNITITNNERAYLAEKPLIEDLDQDIISELQFYWASWISLALLFFFSVYQFWRWRNQHNIALSQAEITKELDERFRYADKAPYDIPFEDTESVIAIEENLFRLADKLRKRQEVGHMKLDIPSSVSHTIDKGGFPILLEKRTTLPPDYLILIDRGSAGSHLSNLFHYLAQFFLDKDIFINIFWYDATFDHFWNTDYQDGIGLDYLAQLFGNQRLLVLGNGYELINQFSNKLEVHQASKDGFSSWSERLLLTPVPTVSWTYKEAVIYQLFPLFEATASGFSQAMEYLEKLFDEEGQTNKKSFINWSNWQLQPPERPSINNRDWKNVNTYADYLKDYPDILRWVRALSVYPKPNWNLTLAIGNAIKAPIHFDSLLIISQIPWLNEEIFSSHLRHQLLDELDDQTEILARTAVRDMLMNASSKVAGSHANLELQTNLCIQSFLLDPTNDQNIAAIKRLSQQKILNKKQLLDIDHAIKKKTKGEVSDLATYVAQIEGDNKSMPRVNEKYLNKHFYLGILTSVFLLGLGILMYSLNGSSTLYQWVKGNSNPPQELIKSTPEDYLYFLKEAALIDSAAIYNNLGVSLWKEEDEIAMVKENKLDKAIEYFGKALLIKPAYDLAYRNSIKAHFNKSTLLHNENLEGEKNTAIFSKAREGFILVEKDSILRLEGMHGKGLSYYYENNILAAERIFKNLNNVGFFDTFPLEPNLSTFYNSPLVLEEDCGTLDFRVLNSNALCVGIPVEIENTSINRNSILYYSINWQEGKIDTISDFATMGHVFLEKGRRTISVIAYRDCGDGKLEPRKMTRIISIGNPPQPIIEASHLEGCPPLDVAFSFTSASSVERYQWGFGEGILSQEAISSYTFTKEGRYSVILTTNNFCGEAIDSTSIIILPNEECEDSIVIRQDSQVVNNNISDSSFVTTESIDLLGSTFNLKDRRALVGTKLILYEIGLNGEEVPIDSLTNTSNNSFPFSLERGKKYRVKATKDGFSSDLTDLDTEDPVYKDLATIEKKFYLDASMDLMVSTWYLLDTTPLTEVRVELYDITDPRGMNSRIDSSSNSVIFRIERGRKYMIIGFRPGFIGMDTTYIDLADPAYAQLKTATADLYLGQLLEVNTFAAGTLQPLSGCQVELYDLSEGAPKLVSSSVNTLGYDFKYPLYLDRPYLVKAIREGYFETVTDTLRFRPEDALAGNGRLIFDIYLSAPFEVVLYFDEGIPRSQGGDSTTTNVSYIETNENYYAKKDIFIKEFTKGIESKLDSFVISRRFQDFFDRDVNRAPERLIEFADRLLAELAAEEEVTLLLMGADSPRGPSSESLQIAARRIDSVMNFFRRYRNPDGIALKQYIDSGQLSFIKRNFGENPYDPDIGVQKEEYDQNISDNVDDLRNSVYDLVASARRHVRIRSLRKESAIEKEEKK